MDKVRSVIKFVLVVALVLRRRYLLNCRKKRFHEENCRDAVAWIFCDAVLMLELAEASSVKQIRITFDPNLTREIMPSMTRNVRDRQVKGMPHELVKDYKVEALLGGDAVWSKEVSGNYQRLNIHDLKDAVKCDTIRITVLSTHGIDAARIYEVRAY